jgi:HD-like signal output (HDOD) protein
VLLGITRIRGLVLMEYVCKKFIPAQAIEGLRAEELWNRALLTAEAARRITKLEGQGEDRPDQACTAGLLHDIGILVLACRTPRKYQEVLNLALSAGRSVWDVERELLGATHPEVGACLLGLWGLPPRIVEGVALHHNPSALAYNGLCAVTAAHAADVLVAEQLHNGPGLPPDLFAPVMDTLYLQRIALAHRLDAWRAQVKTVCEEAEAAKV